MSQCTACGKSFSCAMVDPADGGPCWCTTLAPLSTSTIAALAETTGARCLCPTCLAAATSAVAAQPLT